MKRLFKQVSVLTCACGLSVSLATTAFAATGIGPGYEIQEEDTSGQVPGTSQTDQGESGQEDQLGPGGPGDPQVPAEEPEVSQPEQPAVSYPEGRKPNTSLSGGNVDITSVNGAAIWDAVEIYGQPAEKPDQFTWLSVKFKDGYEGMLSYRVYVNNGGWLPFVGNGTQCGGTEGSTYVEGIQMHLTGDAAEKYDLYYAVATAQRGQLGFASEGQIAGAINVGDSVKDLKVVLVPKGTGAPASSTDRYFNEFSGRIGFNAEGAYCYNTDGTPYTGWADYDMMRFYFENGEKVTGWKYIDGLKYMFASNGELIQDVRDVIGEQDSYVLKINKTLNCLTVYAKDGDNGYVIPVVAMLTSVGDDTPIGTFSTPERYRWRLMVNDTYTQYATRIKAGAGFLFHSITYETTDPMTLITSGYNGLGVIRSAGCIRLTCENAKWIYDNCELGTEVVIYEDSAVPSPFMKPYVVLIPEDQKYDPTDPNIK